MTVPPDMPTTTALLQEAINGYFNDRNPVTDAGIRLALAGQAVLNAWHHRVALEQTVIHDAVGLADLQRHGVGG